MYLKSLKSLHDFAMHSSNATVLRWLFSAGLIARSHYDL